jgi:hypothetical protein
MAPETNDYFVSTNKSIAINFTKYFRHLFMFLLWVHSNPGTAHLVVLQYSKMEVESMRRAVSGPEGNYNPI